jgi:hypothetical protein
MQIRKGIPWKPEIFSILRRLLTAIGLSPEAIEDIIERLNKLSMAASRVGQRLVITFLIELPEESGG